MLSLTQAPLPFAPHRCLATSREDGEIIDFGVDVNINEPFPRLYLQRGVVEEAAREVCGMVSGAEVAEVRRQMADLSHHLDEVLDEVQLTKDFEKKFGESLQAGVNVEPATPAGEEGIPYA